MIQKIFFQKKKKFFVIFLTREFTLFHEIFFFTGINGKQS
jgi:hypothetical protein